MHFTLPIVISYQNKQVNEVRVYTSKYLTQPKDWKCIHSHSCRALEKENCEWFYSSVKNRFKHFGSAKVVRTLYKQKTECEYQRIWFLAFHRHHHHCMRCHWCCWLFCVAADAEYESAPESSSKSSKPKRRSTNDSSLQLSLSQPDDKILGKWN